MRLRAEEDMLPGGAAGCWWALSVLGSLGEDRAWLERLGVGVMAPCLEGAEVERRARADVTEDRVPFLEMVSDPALDQGRVRGAMASSLVSREERKGCEKEGVRSSPIGPSQREAPWCPDLWGTWSGPLT